MGTLIHSVGHGLVADDTIMLGNLVGGEGLSENTLYYVLAAGLTADDFAVSLTSGGAAVTYTTDITDGVIVRSDTYAAVADGVMDPPTAVGTPGDPTLTSTTVSGVIRLFIENPTFSDGDSRIRLTETQVTHHYDGATPVWESALLISMVPGTTNFSIPALGSTQYSARSRVLDVYGNYSGYSNVVSITTEAGDDSKSIVDGAVTTTKIADNSITTAKLQAQSITADLLAATIILTSLLKTAESGKRVEVDSFGIRLYDSTDELLVNIPTTSDPVYVKGQVNASSLISQSAATLYGTNSLPGSSVTTLANGISAPSNVPTVVASVDYTSITTPTGAVSTAAGIAYDSAAGTFWLACDPTVAPNYVAQEFNATTGALVRSISRTGSTSVVTTTLGSTSHVSDSAQAYSGTTNSHIATPLTMPRAGRITKVSVYLAGYGGSATCYNVIWTDVSGTGNYVAKSASYTAASASFNNGNSVQYNKSLTSPYSVASGATIYAGVYHSSSGDGIQYDRDDGSGKTTYSGDGNGTATADFDGTGWGTQSSSSKPNVYITYEYDVNTLLETAPNIGIATDGTYIYTLDNTGKVWKYLRSDGSYVGSYNISSDITGTVSKAGLMYDATNTKLVVLTTIDTTASSTLRYIQYDPAAIASPGTAKNVTGLTVNGATDTIRGGANVVDPLNGSAQTYWVSVSGVVYAVAPGVAASVTANRNFGTSATALKGVTHDGTQFRGYDSSSATKVWKFSSWDFTTTSTTLWVAYSWYDSAGTTHETAMGPRTSLTIRRRERVAVSNAAIPTGGADDPNNVRIYALQNATDTGAGTFWLQATDALTSRYLTSYTGSGTHDGAGTAFAAGTSAILKSATTGWQLNGDGTHSGIIPAGVIVMWSGETTTIPSGWYLCDGTNGTPDLRDRFIVGASTTNENTSGGTVSATAALTHAGTAVSAHSAHMHLTPFIDDDTHTLSTTSAAYGQSSSVTRKWTGSFSSAASAYPVAETSDTTVSAHTVTQPNDHAIPYYYRLAFIMKA